MPWVPTTGFEEEIVNLQPRHDFIYGVFSQPHYSYPRPKSHTEYAANKRIKDKEEQKERRAGKFNEKLRVIQQVQRMACTKPLGEQPSIDDWESNKMIEQETIGMMRYFGMGASVEQPLDQEVTIATYPVENSVKLFKNGRRKVVLFFDNDVFKLKEKVLSHTSGSCDSCNNSVTGNFDNNCLNSELAKDSSFNTTSSLSLNSFNTTAECNDSLEDMSLLSLHSFESSSCSDAFETSEESSFWKPDFGDENIFNENENWPLLCKKDSACTTNSLDNSDLFNERKSDSTDDDSSEASSWKQGVKVNFLDCFITRKLENIDAINTAGKSADAESKTYASIM